MYCRTAAASCKEEIKYVDLDIADDGDDDEAAKRGTTHNSFIYNSGTTSSAVWRCGIHRGGSGCEQSRALLLVCLSDCLLAYLVF